MLLKWKYILTNWINCYCNERDNKDLNINLESLLTIISQLRRNLSLDDSRSSLLEAQNIQEFILEKFPDFKFENGTCDPRSEEDLYLSASLLLFFVCVNSKNIDLKNAMCSKLSPTDQEIIMKFSKCLMGCANITSSEVLQAITEACGQDIAGAETVVTNTVAETPPALRSLHSEVRRLQAALDAERFDRNYLQEELSRTNLKLEKLSKVKEQYKQEIVNLKAQVSHSCCEANNNTGNETSHNNSVKLAKQLEQAEERLASLQEELSNVEHERNGYKNKLDELKRDRDKYLALSQQENIRASQLAEELDSERRQCNSLRELVTELRQHNHLNRMDSSMLECDELDTSVHSLQHNSSVCSEVCASIIEVQLAEERSKIATLKTQMQMLQDQLTELNNKYEKEKNDFVKTLSEKEYDIMNLKHRINEEIESKNVIKSKCDNDITKLNNEINELEQILKDTNENARKTIDTKMQEIQTLQEEKLSLLQSFSNETLKLECKVQELKKEIESEKTSKQKMNEDYDNHIMKLNEKVLNRNNELVELQNKIVTNGEEIESLHIQLRNEKDMRQELISKHNNDVLHYNNVIKEQNLNAQKNLEDLAELRKQVQQYYECMEEMNKERNNLNASLLGLKEEVKNLTSEKQNLLKEKDKLENKFSENNETITSLKSQLQTEIQFKNEIQTKLRKVESHKEVLFKENNTLTNELSSVIDENSRTCEKLKEEVKDLTDEKQTLLKDKEKLEKENSEKIATIDSLERKFQTEIQLKNEIQNRLREEESYKEVLLKEKDTLTNKLSSVIAENANTCEKIKEEVRVLTNEKQTLMKEKEKLENEKNEIITSLKSQVKTEIQLKNEIESKLREAESYKEVLLKEKDTLIDKLSSVISENANALEKIKEEVRILTNEKQTLLKEKEKLENEKNEIITSLKSQIKTEIQLKNEIQSKLREIESYKEVLLKEKDTLTDKLSSVIAENAITLEKIKEEVRILTNEKQALMKEKDKLKKENDETIGTINTLESKLQIEIKLKKEIESKLCEVESYKEVLLKEKDTLTDKMSSVTAENANACEKLKEKLNVLTNEKQTLLKEKDNLENEFDKNNEIIASLRSQLRTEIKLKNETQCKLDEVESDKEVLLKEKDTLTNKLSSVIAENTIAYEKLKEEVKDLTNEIQTFQKEKEILENENDEKYEMICSLKKQLQIESIQLHNEKDMRLQNEEESSKKIGELLDLVKIKNDEFSEQIEEYKSIIEEKSNEVESLVFKNATLHNELNEVKIQLDTKVHSLKDKLIDNENITDKLKATYESQIENLNVMVSKLTDYLKEKTIEIEATNKEKVQLQEALKKSNEDIALLDEEVKCLKQTHEKLLNEFESERVVLKNIVSVTEDVMEDQKLNFNIKMTEVTKQNEELKDHIKKLEEQIFKERMNVEISLKDNEEMLNIALKDLSDVKDVKKSLEEENLKLKDLLSKKTEEFESATNEKKSVEKLLDSVKNDKSLLENKMQELEMLRDNEITDNLNLLKEKENETKILKEELERQTEAIKQFERLHEALSKERDEIVEQLKEKINLLEIENGLHISQLEEIQKLQRLQTENDTLQNIIKERELDIGLLEEEVKCEKQKHDKLIAEFECERIALKNLVSVTEDGMVDLKLNLNDKIIEVTKQNEELKDHIKKFEEQISIERMNAEMTLKDKEEILNLALKDLSDIKDLKKSIEEESLMLKDLCSKKTVEFESAISEKIYVEKILEGVNNDKTLVENKMQELEILKDQQIIDYMNLLKEKENEIKMLKEELERQREAIKQFESLQEALSKERDEIAEQLKEKDKLLDVEKNLRISQLDEMQKLQHFETENIKLQDIIKVKESETIAIKEHLENEIDQNQQVSDQNKIEQSKLVNKCEILEEYQIKAEEELKHRQAKIEVLVSEMESLKKEYAKVEVEKNILIEKLETELSETKNNYIHYKQETEKCNAEIGKLRENLNAVNTNTVYNLKKENELLLKAVTNKENMAGNNKENVPNYREDIAIKIRDLQNQVHDSAFDNTTSSTDSSKTINDLEKIIQDKNRTITTLHSDITYLKTLIAESENKLLDVTKDLDLSRENCHQLSKQLKKVVLQKNEEIAELRNKISKMSVTETSASQILKLSAKYQAMIIKRIAEIKSNTVLKEVTNFSNSANGENELRRSLAGHITMEDLENFLETTDRHIKRCSEKQIVLQKERDRLVEINKINDSEIIAMRKFLTELSVSVKTFNSVKDLYSQKLNKVIALQRTVRREILNLDGRINDATMCKLERGYAAIMQDLSECALNLERWVDRSIVRSISPEKIKQAFMSELDRASLVPTNFQNTSLEIQFGELESSFHKLLKEVMQAQSGDGAKDAQAMTIMEVRAEYEDKLSRMKARMKELYVDQIGQFQEKHKKVIEEYERKLEKAQEESKELSKAYQQHIRSLTTELWNVGEKFIIQKDEAQWLRKQQKSGSLMSLQHVHSAGLLPPHEDPGRPSDTLSLRSLQVHNKNDRKGRKTCGDISDEEGEVFDNRCLRELTETPRRGRPSVGGPGRVGGATGGARLSELQRRNTLCQPHLKSSYPAETQFVPGVREDDIKCYGSMSLGGKARKEVGITAYKKPGPPTPSKQAGRLSATDSELRESLRVESSPGARRTATPSRLFSLFRGKQDTIEGTPRGRRLSNIFRKK